jgi:branched-chain amino acid transport system ATP-binding protein
VTLLEVEHLTVTYGANRALDDLSLSAAKGTVVGLVGANGAGKTTALDAITGFVPSTGIVRMAGTDLALERPHVRARAGFSRTWQGVQLFDDLSVRENLLVGVGRHGWRATFSSFSRTHRDRAIAGVVETLNALGLGVEELLERPASGLSQGERKLVGLCRSLVNGPQVLFADEPAAGLDSDESGQLSVVLRRLAEAGLTTLLVDHDMGLVLSACDDIYVLDHGVLIAHGPPSEIRRDRAVLASYLGTDGRDAAALETESIT